MINAQLEKLKVKIRERPKGPRKALTRSSRSSTSARTLPSWKTTRR